MKIEIELTGFTPVLDNLVQEYSLVTAAIYGIVWRYAQMSNKVCKAPLDRIGQRLDLSGKTAERHIKILCKDSYLIDLTPNIRNVPHSYAITGKAELTGIISSRSDRESDPGQTESPTRSDRESDPGQTESPLKIHNKIHNKKDHGAIAPQNSTYPFLSLKINEVKEHLKDLLPNELRLILADEKANKNRSGITRFINHLLNNDKGEVDQPWGDMFKALADCCVYDTSVLSGKDRGQMASAAKKMLKNGYTSSDVEEFRHWFDANTWQGQKGQAPTIAQIRSMWGQYRSYKNGSTNGTSTTPDLSDHQLKKYQELASQQDGRMN